MRWNPDSLAPMNDRLHDWLDGTLPFEALTPEERAEARAAEAMIRSVSGHLTGVPAPDLTATVMERLPAHVAPGSRAVRARRWLGARLPHRGVALQPAAALAALAMVVGFGLGLLVSSALPEGTAAGADTPHLFVRFELEAAGARDVRLAGSFSDWVPEHAMTPVGVDRWTVTVPLDPGVHDYIFVVDGDTHVVDPYAPRIADGFGGYSSRLALLAPTR